jgi:ABC-2 type transport system permease protein
VSLTGTTTGSGSSPPPSAGGAVYDRGYRPYEGARGGRSAARWALWRLSVRRTLGIRRSWRQKVVPWTLLGLATLPTIISVGAEYLARQQDQFYFPSFITFRSSTEISTLLLLFVAVAAPDVVCPDRHDRVLPLIFSRQLTGTDYVVAKVGAVAAVIFGFGLFPQLVLFFGQMFVSPDGSLDYYLDHDEVIWQAAVALGLFALYYALISVAVASLTDRRVVGAIAFVGIMLIPHTISQVPVALADGDPTAAGLMSLVTPPRVLRDVVFLGEVHFSDPLSGVAGGAIVALLIYLAVVGVATSVLVWRYREVQL